MQCIILYMHELNYTGICAISPMVCYVLPLNSSLLDIPLLQPYMPSMHHFLCPPPLSPNTRRLYAYVYSTTLINNSKGWGSHFYGTHWTMIKNHDHKSTVQHGGYLVNSCIRRSKLCEFKSSPRNFHMLQVFSKIWAIFTKTFSHQSSHCIRQCVLALILDWQPSKIVCTCSLKLAITSALLPLFANVNHSIVWTSLDNWTLIAVVNF